MKAATAELWDRVWVERRFVSDYERLFLAELVRRAPRARHVLEAGCGRAGVLRRVLETGRWTTAVGLDLSGEALVLAGKDKPAALQLVQGDLFRLPFPADTFDLVYNSGVIEHFNDARLEEALRGMVRVTRPGGRVLAVVPNAACLWYRAAKAWLMHRGRWRFGFERHLSARAMRAFARHVGLEDVRTRALLLFPPACDGYRLMYPRWIRRVFDCFEWVFAPLARRFGYALIVTGTKPEATA